MAKKVKLNPAHLMKGDWFKIGRDKWKVSEVLGSNSHWSVPCVRTEMFQDAYDGTEIKPIPLTEAILDKNGFVGDTRSAYAYNKGGVYLINLHAEIGEMQIYDEKGHDTSGYVCRSVNVPSLMNVHELQQAFRLCGLHELAEGFQV